MDNFLSEEQTNSYKNYGAIVIKNVFEPWIETLQKGFDKVLANPGPYARENVKNNEGGRISCDTYTESFFKRRSISMPILLVTHFFIDSIDVASVSKIPA